MSRAGFKVAFVVCALLLTSCGDDDGGVSSEEDASEDGGWWLLDASAFTLVDGGPADEAIADSTGQRWVLEYSDGVHTLQLQAWDSGSDFVSLVRQYPDIGSATIAGFDATLRQGPGIPSKDIAPSVGADWTDGDVFLSFGGGALTEADVRDLLGKLRRVAQLDWEAVVEGVPGAGRP